MRKHFYVKYGDNRSMGIAAITRIDDSLGIILNDSLMVALIAYFQAKGRPNVRLMMGPYVDKGDVPNEADAVEIGSIAKYGSLVELCAAAGVRLPEEGRIILRPRKAGLTAALNNINRTLEAFLVDAEKTDG